MGGEAGMLKERGLSAKAERLVEHWASPFVIEEAGFSWRHLVTEYCSVSCKIGMVIV